MCGTQPESLWHGATDRREREASSQQPAALTGKQKQSNFPLKGMRREIQTDTHYGKQGSDETKHRKPAATQTCFKNEVLGTHRYTLT